MDFLLGERNVLKAQNLGDFLGIRRIQLVGPTRRGKGGNLKDGVVLDAVCNARPVHGVLHDLQKLLQAVPRILQQQSIVVQSVTQRQEPEKRSCSGIW